MRNVIHIRTKEINGVILVYRNIFRFILQFKSYNLEFVNEFTANSFVGLTLHYSDNDENIINTDLCHTYILVVFTRDVSRYASLFVPCVRNIRWEEETGFSHSHGDNENDHKNNF